MMPHRVLRVEVCYPADPQGISHKNTKSKSGRRLVVILIPRHSTPSAVQLARRWRGRIVSGYAHLCDAICDEANGTMKRR